MRRPAFGLHGVDFRLDGGPGKARGRCARGRRADERSAGDAGQVFAGRHNDLSDVG